MKQIPLTKNKVALVDDEDYEYINQFKWFAYCNKGNWYAGRTIIRPNGKRGTLQMHRDIMRPKQGQYIDHINGNGLDNRRQNLRICNIKENNRHRLKHDYGNPFRGVVWHKARKKWAAIIGINNKTIHLGLFTSPIEAALTRDRVAQKYHGEFAVLNFGFNSALDGGGKEAKP